jgi:tetratricopeptide (TPR) repeat protein
MRVKLHPGRWWKKALGGISVCVIFFAVLELGFWAAGMPTLLEKEDPSRGFSGLVSVFEQEGDVYRTRPAVVGSTFNDQSFLVNKPTEGIRIFCLGGSSSYGFPWDAEAAFGGILRDVTAAAHPDKHVEVVNASGISYAMHRLNIVADELLAYAPDIFVIYSGHNEFVEPAFYDALKQRSGARTRLEHALAHSRVYAGMKSLVERSRESEFSTAFTFDALVRRDQTRTYSAEEKEEIVGEFRSRLERLVTRAQAAGVNVLLSTVPCNLSEWRPQQSNADRTLDERDRGSWSGALRAGRRLLEEGDMHEASVALERAVSLAPGYAEVQYLLAQAYEGLGEWDHARRAYALACDLDATPSRRISAINSAIRDVANMHGALLVDMDAIFHQQSENGLVGFNLIEDYVHPTREGHETVAWHMWDAMEKAEWLGLRQQASKTLFDEIITERNKRPMTANYAVWFYNQGVILAKQGNKAAAIEKYRRAVALSPQYVGAMANLGALLNETGQHAEALSVLRRAVEIMPDSAESNNYMADALRGLGRAQESIGYYEKALKLRPSWDTACVNFGAALESLGRLDEAVDKYEEALQRRPDAAAIHHNLAVLLKRLERFKQAEDHEREALSLEPDLAEAHNGLAIALFRQGNLTEAMMHFERALALRPEYQSARDNLVKIREQLGTRGHGK